MSNKIKPGSIIHEEKTINDNSVTIGIVVADSISYEALMDEIDLAKDVEYAANEKLTAMKLKGERLAEKKNFIARKLHCTLCRILTKYCLASLDINGETIELVRKIDPNTYAESLDVASIKKVSISIQEAVFYHGMQINVLGEQKKKE